MSEEKNKKKQEFIEKANADPDLQEFTAEQRLQLYALKMTRGNKTKAAMMLGLKRAAIWYHIKKNRKYKAMVDEIEEMAIDIVEDKLNENIDNNDTTAIIFFLKTRGSKRGYVEQTKTDVTTKGESLNKGFADFLKEVAVTE